MHVKPLDILLGFKAFGLARELKDSDRRVGCALLDHYNKKTTQCDPSLDTLAVLVGMSRRSVIRSVNRLVRLGFFRRARHGGNYHRNSYEPAWDRLRAVEAWWRNLRKMNSRRFRTQELASSQCQAEHPTGDAGVTQTNTINLSEETYSTQAVNNGHASTAANSAEKEAADVRKRPCLARPLRNETSKPTPPSSIAALDAAERRWTRALQAKFLKVPDVYARVLDAIDRALQEEITLVERDKPGRAIFVLLERLRIKGVI
jgi:hypothetical protein